MLKIDFFLAPSPQHASECGSDLEKPYKSPLGDEILNLCVWIMIDEVIKIGLFLSTAPKLLLGSSHMKTVDFGSLSWLWFLSLD